MASGSMGGTKEEWWRREEKSFVEKDDQMR